MKKMFALVLMLCVLFVCMAGTAFAEAFQGYIESIGIVAADTAAAAKQKLTETGHTVIDVDLNEGTEHGRRVYMGYKRTMDPDEAITGFALKYSGYQINFSPEDSFDEYNLVEYNLVGGTKEPNTAGTGIVDLNDGTYSSMSYFYPIHLYVSRDESRSPLVNIVVLNDDKVPEGYYEPFAYCTYRDFSDNQLDLSNLHLNYGAEGGRMLYMYGQRFSDTHTGVTLTSYSLTASGEIEHRKASKYLKDHTEKVSLKAPPQSVIYDGVSYHFEGWNDRALSSGAPTYTKADLEAGMSTLDTLGSSHYPVYYAVYSHDLTLNFSAEGGTGAPAALTQKQYLYTYQREVRQQSKTFTIPENTPTSTDSDASFYGWCTAQDGNGTLYKPGDTVTLSGDMTLYALWTVNSSECIVKLENTSYVSDGKTERKPRVTVTHDGNTLKEDVDYKVSYDRNVYPGTAKVTVIFQGQYAGTANAYFTISELKISADATVPSKTNPNNYTVPPQTGNSTKAVTMTAVVDGNDVTSQTRWTIDGANASQSTDGISVQDNQIIFTSGATEGRNILVTGTYADGKANCWIRVQKNSVPVGKVIPGRTLYDGMEQRPTVIVGDGTLVEGEDYTITYLRNGETTTDFTNAGKIEVQVKGINDYTGTITHSYFIDQVDMINAQAEYISQFGYDGQPHKPEIALTLDSGYELREGVDYTLTYMRGDTVTDDFTSNGKITVLATAVEGGNFSSDKKISYEIKPKFITDGISITAPTVTYDGTAHEPVVEVTFDGETLTEGTDYTVTCTRNGEVTTDFTSAGSVQVTVAGKEPYYTGSSQKSYTISSRWIYENMVTVSPDTVFNGSEQKPKVTANGVLESDFAVTYKRDGVETTDFTSCGTIALTIAAANSNVRLSQLISKEYVINHTQDYSCCGGAGFAMKYQASEDTLPIYTNDIAVLNTEGGGTVTLLDDITIGNYIYPKGLTLVMNGHSITLSDDYYIVTTRGSLTVDASAGGSFHREPAKTWFLEMISCGNYPVTIIGAPVFDNLSGVKMSTNSQLDLSQYTGEGLIVYNYSREQTNTPSLSNGYGIVSWSSDTGPSDTGYEGNTIPKGKYGMVKRFHTHDWNYTASGNILTATCGNVDCTVENGSVTLTLSAPADLTYNGQAKAVTVTQTPDGIFTDVPAVTYAGNCIDAGEHIASLTYGGATAQLKFTIEPKDATDATVGAFASLTYTGLPQTPSAPVTMDGTPVTGTWSSVTNVGEKTTFTATGNYTSSLEARDPGMKKAIPTADAIALTLPQNPYYTGEGKAAFAAAAAGVNGLGEITLKYQAENGTISDAAPSEAGVYGVLADIAEGSNYAAAADLHVGTMSIVQSASELNVTTDKREYTHGDQVEITVIPLATGSAVRFSLRRFTAPAAGQVALYRDDTQITEPLPAGNGVAVTFTLDTVAEGFDPGSSYTLTAKYTGDDGMAEQIAQVTFFVDYADTPEKADVSGDKNEAGWHRSDPKLKAPEGSQISLDGQDWSDELALPTEEGEHEYPYYLKDENGRISKKSAKVKVDKSAPTIEKLDIEPSPTGAEITAPATDEYSGVLDYALTHNTGEEELTITNNGNGSFTIEGMVPGKTYDMTLTVRDKVGHTLTVSFGVTAAQLPSLPETGDNSSLGLWLMLLGMAFAGVITLRRRAHN